MPEFEKERIDDVKQNKMNTCYSSILCLDDVIKWKHIPRYWPFVRGIHRSPVNSPHKCQWRGALMFLIVLRLNKRLSKQLWGWWFETPSRPLWHHCNATFCADKMGHIPRFIDTLGQMEQFNYISTHLPMNKMAVISQTMFSDAFLWMKFFFISIKISLKFVPIWSNWQ